MSTRRKFPSLGLTSKLRGFAGEQYDGDEIFCTMGKKAPLGTLSPPSTPEYSVSECGAPVFFVFSGPAAM